MENAWSTMPRMPWLDSWTMITSLRRQSRKNADRKYYGYEDHNAKRRSVRGESQLSHESQNTILGQHAQVAQVLRRPAPSWWHVTPQATRLP